MAAAYTAIARDGMVGGWYTVADPATGAEVQGRLVVGTAARVRVVLPHPATVAVGGRLTAVLEVLAADGTPFSAQQVHGRESVERL